MAHGHSHGHGGAPELVPASRRVRLILGIVVGLFALVTLVAVGVLGPRTMPTKPTGSGESVTYLDATVASRVGVEWHSRRIAGAM